MKFSRRTVSESTRFCLISKPSPAPDGAVIVSTPQDLSLIDARRAVDLFGADRVMWGSDIGTSSGTYKDMVQRMIAASDLLTPEEQRKVWHDTGRRVFAKGGHKGADK